MNDENRSEVPDDRRIERPIEPPTTTDEEDDPPLPEDPMNRRQFLGGTAGAAAGLFALGSKVEEVAAEPGRTATVAAGHLRLTVKETGDGIHVQRLSDELGQRELQADQTVPLWEIVMYDPNSEERAFLRADQGWEQVGVDRGEEQEGEEEEEDTEGGSATLRWGQSADDRFEDLTVTARVEPHASDDSLHWDLSVDNDSDWAVYDVSSPQIAVARQENYLEPRLEGWEYGDSIWNVDNNHRYFQPYPNGSKSCMQWVAAYTPSETGLYVGMHDPEPAIKNVKAESPEGESGLAMGSAYPAEDMVVAGNDFELSGEVVWQLFEGDWYDAAMIYRDWVSEHASWYPDLGDGGREDTPEYMKEIPFWTMMHSDRKDIEETVERAKELQEFMDVPIGGHWYGWFDHEFDTLYPSYPPKEGFTEGVHELQDAGVHVMPYINTGGWDTYLDSYEEYGYKGGTEDPEGHPFIDFAKFFRRDPDGSRVRFHVMDPSTDIWQDKIREICLGLFEEHGVDGVYLDVLGRGPYRGNTHEGGTPHQNEPRLENYPDGRNRELGDPSALCFDEEHDHPQGGGSWFSNGYQEMLAKIQDEMPDDRFLTGEHTHDDKISGIDGLLTIRQGRGFASKMGVPAFQAVYGGAVQTFGRSYNRGGLGQRVMARMRTANALVYGSQLGWTTDRWRDRNDFGFEDPIWQYIRRLVHLRYRLTPYFTEGQMARPPDIDAPVEGGEWIFANPFTIRRPSVEATAWERPDEDKLLLVFANWTEDDVTTDVELDLKEYGMEGPVTVRRIGPDGPTGEEFTIRRRLDREVSFEPKAAWAWEIVTDDEERGDT